MMIKGANLRLHHQTPEQVIAQLDSLAGMGANAVALVPHHYMRLVHNPITNNNEIVPPPPGLGLLNTRGQPWWIFPDLGHPIGPYGNTVSPFLVYHAASYARSLGLEVWLKPHIDPLRLGDDGRWYPAGWRGWAVLVPSRLKDFLWSYVNRFLAPYVSIANGLGCGLVLGTEFYSISLQHKSMLWLEVLGQVRKVFKGPITYSANWGGWGDDAEWLQLREFWYQVDYIGLSAYFPLPTHDWDYSPAPPWHPRVYDWLTKFAREMGKQLLFTEIGYPNRTGADTDPMRDPLPEDQIDNDLQLRLYQAMLTRWVGDPLFAGYLVWEADKWANGIITHQIFPGTPVARLLFGGGEDA